MVNELIVCAAAFFQNKGRNVIAEKEFTMGISLDYRWMSVNEAKSLMNAMVSADILESKGGYLRPRFKESEVSVPIAYRPSAKLIASLTSIKTEKVTLIKDAAAVINDPTAVKNESLTPIKDPSTSIKDRSDVKKEPANVKKDQDDNVFSKMISMAEKAGMRRAGYIAACNSVQKKLDVDIEVAGVMILRDIGADVSNLYEKVRTSVLSK